MQEREDSRINFLLNILIKKKNPDIGSGKKGGGIRDTRFTFVWPG